MFDPYATDPYCPIDPDLLRFADDGGPAVDCVTERTTMQIETTDPHAHDFHVYVDGTLRHRVPCGVCEGPDNAAIADVGRRYGVELHSTIREQVRKHLESAYRLTHPDSAIRVE